MEHELKFPQLDDGVFKTKYKGHALTAASSALQLTTALLDLPILTISFLNPCVRCCSMLGGTLRMSMSLTVILLETTDDIEYAALTRPAPAVESCCHLFCIVHAWKFVTHKKIVSR